MTYGHGSWIALVVFGGMFAIRYLSSQRRQSGGAGTAGPRNSLTSSDRRGPSSPPTGRSGGRGGTESGTAPGWFADPFCKHEQRYWSGTAWTEHVIDDSVPGTDPPPHTTG
jgi:hypothetical protein